MKKLLILVLLCLPFMAHAQNTGIGTTSPLEFFSVGASSQFRVDANGNVVRIRDVQYSFPSAQATSAGLVLVNNGSGTLSWSKVTTANIAASGTPDATTYLRGDGAWAAAGGAEQFPALLSSNNLSGSTFANVATPWLPLYSTNATSTGLYMVHVNLAVSSTTWGNVANMHIRVSVGGSPVSGAYHGTIYAPYNPTYFTSTFLLDLTSGQDVSFEYEFEGYGGATTSWTGQVRFVKLSN